MEKQQSKSVAALPQTVKTSFFLSSLERGRAPVSSPEKPRPEAGRAEAMTADTQTARPKSGSAKRQRQPVPVMLTPDEKAAIAAKAKAVGLPLGAFLRTLGMGVSTPRTQSARATPDTVALTKLLGQVGKIGGNLNQLAKLGNQGQLVPPSNLADCIAEVRELALIIAEVLDNDH